METSLFSIGLEMSPRAKGHVFLCLSLPFPLSSSKILENQAPDMDRTNIYNSLKTSSKYFASIDLFQFLAKQKPQPISAFSQIHQPLYRLQVTYISWNSEALDFDFLIFQVSYWFVCWRCCGGCYSEICDI